METKKLIAAAAVVAAAAALPTASAAGDVTAGTLTAVGGPVSATFSWDAGEGPRNARMKITRDGVTAFDAAIPRVCGEQCSLFYISADDFQVRDLDGDGENEVILEADSDEPCCDILGVYDRRPDGSYREFSKVFELSVRIEDFNRDGRPELRTTDARIDGGPPRIYSYSRAASGPALTDVTRQFPGQIRADASLMKEFLTIGKRPERSVAEYWISEYVADEYLLGHGKVGLDLLDQQADRGVLGTAREAKAFRKRLLRRLERFGYR
jgi:hypothetical protein